MSDLIVHTKFGLDQKKDRVVGYWTWTDSQTYMFSNSENKWTFSSISLIDDFELI